MSDNEMSDHIKNAMQQSWEDWHVGMGMDVGDMPQPNPSFKAGFTYAALNLITDIRIAAGDTEGRMTQNEFIEHVARIYKDAQKVNELTLPTAHTLTRANSAK